MKGFLTNIIIMIYTLVVICIMWFGVGYIWPEAPKSFKMILFLLLETIMFIILDRISNKNEEQ